MGASSVSASIAEVSSGSAANAIAQEVSAHALNVLLIATLPPREAQTVRVHIEAFRHYSRHRIFVYNHYNWLRLGHKGFPGKLDLHRFDVIVIHYSTYLLSENVDYLSATAKQQLGAFKGLKVLFRQDEYNHVDGLIEVLQTIRADILFTTFDEKDASRIYARPGLEQLRKVRTLTGYVPESLLGLPLPSIAERPLDVGYRSRTVPYWLGSLGLEKVEIAKRFSDVALKHGLTCDISSREEDRLYGDDWIEFLTSCRVVLGTESGSSVVDFTGEIRRKADNYVAHHPRAGFEEVRAHCFADKEWEYDQAQISPRCFEAAALKNGMVLYEGKYSGFLEPWRHYVPLKKDFSNIEEVVGAIKDVGFLQQLVDRTYLEVAQNPCASYKSFIAGFDKVIEEEACARGIKRATNFYQLGKFQFTTGQRRDLSIRWYFLLLWVMNGGVRLAAKEEQLPGFRLSPVILASPLSFQTGQDLQSVAEDNPTNLLVTALDGQPLPQSFSIHLPGKVLLQVLRIRWGEDNQCPRDFEVQFLRGATSVKKAHIVANQSDTTEIQTDWLVCDRVHISISAFSGVGRLTIRQVEALGCPTLPLAQRLWRKLPIEARFVVYHLCRAPFRRVRRWVGRILPS